MSRTRLARFPAWYRDRTGIPIADVPYRAETLCVSIRLDVERITVAVSRERNAVQKREPQFRERVTNRRAIEITPRFIE